MEKKRYRLFVVCVREECKNKGKIVKKGIHVECNFTSDEEALERCWHIVQKDLVGFFDRIICSVLQGGIRVGTFRFPEKRA